MLALIDRQFSTSIQVQHEHNEPVTIISYRNILDYQTQHFKFRMPFSLHDALLASTSQVREKYRQGNFERTDIIKCICEQWWEYSNTLFSYSSLARGQISDFSLGALEFYIQRFSIEMANFLDNLAMDETSLIAATLSADIPAEHPYYSELRAAKTFKFLRDSLIQAK